ncbi:hypothetical protein [Rubidibacter lacunae]|uniref:hypothetical protein n=1 Tax=Rubidibacter lacunae TaxID=582514 RepID=UPI0003FAC7FA|nr:hypothetical protein [Rubidibacter lacunae]
MQRVGGRSRPLIQAIAPASSSPRKSATIVHRCPLQTFHSPLSEPKRYFPVKPCCDLQFFVDAGGALALTAVRASELHASDPY